MTTKTIKIDNYQTNIESLESEQATIDTIVTNIYTRFNSASNANNLQYALEVLQGYRYVPNKFRLVPGRYVRYIDTTDHTNMTLRYWNTFSSLAVPVQTEAKQIEVQQTKTKKNAPSIGFAVAQL